MSGRALLLWLAGALTGLALAAGGGTASQPAGAAPAAGAVLPAASPTPAPRWTPWGAAPWWGTGHGVHHAHGAAPTPAAAAGHAHDGHGAHAHPGTGGCLPAAAFCETFDLPFPGGRGGDLDERRWSVSRVGTYANLFWGDLNHWEPAELNRCGQRVMVRPNDDYAVCNGHFMEALNDRNTAYYYNSARIRQPFDFGGRTGTIRFEVDAKSAGHAWWPEIWLTDEPIPAPHASHTGSPPRNGVGLSFGTCLDTTYSTVHYFYVVQDFSLTHRFGHGGNRAVHQDGCVKTVDNVRNVFEFRISAARFELWGSDAGSDAGTQQLKRLAWADTAVDDFSIPFTRAYVHLQHAQYRAADFGKTAQQTYHWDSISFDGPVLPVSRGYDVPDALTVPHADRTGQDVNLAYKLSEKGVSNCCMSQGWPLVPHFTFHDVDLTDAREARLNLTLWLFQRSDESIRYRLNEGGWHVVAWPYPDTDQVVRALSLPVALDELQPGTNTLQLQAATTGREYAVGNVDLEIALADSAAGAQAMVAEGTRE